MTDWQLWREDFAQGYCDVMAGEYLPELAAYRDQAYIDGALCAAKVRSTLKC